MKVSQARSESSPLESALTQAVQRLLNLQLPDGTWWFTLEANETIGAGFIQLMHFLGVVDPSLQSGLAQRMIAEQREDGSWPLFFGGPGDLSTTIECYFALKLAGYPLSTPSLTRARRFIVEQGGLARARVFTRIHLALFGLVPWSSCPSMPVWFILLPSWLGFSIYEFSSWARASIVPLLLVMHFKPIVQPPFDLEELYTQPKGKNLFHFPGKWGLLDRILKVLERLPWHPGRKKALQRAEKWVREHIERTEDIYPAMAYAAIGLKAVGYPLSDPTIQKAVRGLKSFQQKYGSPDLPSSPPSPLLNHSGEGCRRQGEDTELVHQQCCISPLWDTPWAGLALLESGLDRSDPNLLRAARYLVSKEIAHFRGDWRFKNPGGPAGGWSFEFQNDYFPDIDDTIETVFFLRRVDLPSEEKEGSIRRGLEWLLSMQSKNGGWAAFDKNNLAAWVNRIPFSDHGACLDPPTPDITGRMVELLSRTSLSLDHPVLKRALSFLWGSQEENGSWRGRWGVCYIYGTWAVLQGIAAAGVDLKDGRIQRAVKWLQSIQNSDGGWGESCLSDSHRRYVSLGASVPSQTAWALMGLMAAGGKRDSVSVQSGIQWLLENQNSEGSWEEPYYTGTGFPGHFYLNYHGYRHYFPLLALAKYRKA